MHSHFTDEKREVQEKHPAVELRLKLRFVSKLTRLGLVLGCGQHIFYPYFLLVGEQGLNMHLWGCSKEDVVCAPKQGCRRPGEMVRHLKGRESCLETWREQRLRAAAGSGAAQSPPVPSWSSWSLTPRRLAGAELEISLPGTEPRAGRAAGRAGRGAKGKWRLVMAGCFWNFLGDGHCLTLSEPGEGRLGSPQCYLACI